MPAGCAPPCAGHVPEVHRAGGGYWRSRGRLLAKPGEVTGEAGVSIPGLAAFTGEGTGVVHVLLDDQAVTTCREALERAGIGIADEREVLVVKRRGPADGPRLANPAAGRYQRQRRSCLHHVRRREDRDCHRRHGKRPRRSGRGRPMPGGILPRPRMPGRAAHQAAGPLGRFGCRCRDLAPGSGGDAAPRRSRHHATPLCGAARRVARLGHRAAGSNRRCAGRVG